MWLLPSGRNRYQVHVLSLLKSVLELVRDGQHGRVLRIGDGKARRIWERVIEDVRVTNANDLVGCLKGRSR